ncbi:hypothetical protein GCM10020367_51920 [Streptomyces sannanensis]|uniref:Uncharacterized protein n=1 Tax=Streptomyces sannanensis TaxID=285536 RepID=A0ABP6SJ41_9ACTN
MKSESLLRDQAEVFGPVASTPTAWRLLAGIDPTALRHCARPAPPPGRVAWLQAAETVSGIPAAQAHLRNLALAARTDQRIRPPGGPATAGHLNRGTRTCPPTT